MAAMMWGILYALAAVLVGLFVATVVVVHVQNEDREFGWETGPDTYVVAVLAGLVLGAIWFLTVPAILAGFVVRRLVRVHRDVERWTAEAEQMSPERRAAYEAAWRDVDQQDVTR